MKLKDIEDKWQKKWEEAKLFEANPSKKKKFFVNFPYPYINGLPHIGHLFTIMRVEAFARYKRLQGFNVLFPQGWHATGSPIISAAKRIAEKEEKQIKIMKDMGFSDDEIPKFSEPEEWVKYFPKEYKKDLKSIGLSIDWRREFHTTSLNPYYDRFIQWQFNKLKEKNYVIKGKFPVIWCSKCRNAVSDHSRIEGEGETVQEFTLLKFKFNNEYIVAATLRPETVYGQTNLWVGADIEYVKAKVNDELWIMSRECAEKLKEQEKNVEIIGTISGIDLIGKYASAPGIERDIIILPSHFCAPEKGSGIVTSVPSDAPDDYMGLMDLQKDENECRKYGLDPEKIKAIEIIPIIDSKDLGNMAAVKICRDMNIKSQHEREKLEEAKKIVYKKGYYEGVMANNTGKYAGMKVEQAKEKVKKELLKQKKADVLYEMTGKVVCRCLTPSTVKIVDDQWFIDYGNEDWKKLANKCLKNMKLYPDKSRQQFEHVIGWLHAWACTREEGLGTRLPWDKKWLIESLSDSTIYMAYYTISHLIKQVGIEYVNDALFDYIFLNKEPEKSLGINPELLRQMKEEFNYWYPFDFRNSGKDLIQNHLTFCIFNHAAVFNKDKWPRGFGVNGWVTVDGQKMSKSLGNMISVRGMKEKFSADASRLTILNGGESLDDPNWDTEFAKNIIPKLEYFIQLCKDNYNKGVEEEFAIDKWALSQLSEIIRDSTQFMEETLFRSAIQRIYFDLGGVMKWYLKRTNSKPNKKIINKIIEANIIMLNPFVPHTCEEAWENIGKTGFVSMEKWPKYDENKINKKYDASEELVKQAITDINAVIKLSKVENPQQITLFVANPWKYELVKELKKKMEETRNPGDIIKHILSTELKQHGQDISRIVPSMVKSGKVPKYVSSEEDEFLALEEAKKFLQEDFKCKIEIVKAKDSKEDKARNALPCKPAILLR